MAAEGTVTRKGRAFVTLACALLCSCGSGVLLTQNDFDTFTRAQDGAQVRCLRVPPEVVNKGTTLDLNATLWKREVAKVTAGVKFDPMLLIKVSPSINDYRILNRRICLDYAGGIYTREEYKVLQEKILPEIKKQAETNARVDSALDSYRVVDLGDRKRLVVALRIKPVTEDNLEAGNVIYVLAVAHDEAKLPAGHESLPSAKSCAQVPSCLAFHLWDKSRDPIVVRGGTASSSTLEWTIDLPAGVKAVRVFWEMYQREAMHGTCVVDQAKAAPEGGIPFLKVVDGAGVTVKDEKCYRSYGDSVIPV